MMVHWRDRLGLPEPSSNGLRNRGVAQSGRREWLVGESNPLISDSVSLPSVSSVDKTVTFEPISRQLIGSLVVGLYEGFKLDPHAFANMLMREGHADKLSDCIDGRTPLARIDLNGKDSALLAVNSDRRSGTLQVDIYRPPSSEPFSGTRPLSRTSLFALKEYLHHIARFLYNSGDMEEKGLRTQDDIVKFKYISDDVDEIGCS